MVCRSSNSTGWSTRPSQPHSLMARFTNCGSKRKGVSERASPADRECDPVRRRRPVHEGHTALRHVRKLLARPRSAAARRRPGDGGRRPARPPDPPGAFRDLELADDPPGLRPRRVDRRRRHRRGAGAERRAGANARGETRSGLPRHHCRAGNNRRVAALTSRLGPSHSFVVLGFGIAMTMNFDIPYNQFWIIFGLVAWALSAATGILFLGA